jgi:hypothetical protein
MNLCQDINALKIPNPLKLSLLSVAGTVGGFWVPNLLYYLIWKNNLFLQYKIQGYARWA